MIKQMKIYNFDGWMHGWMIDIYINRQIQIYIKRDDNQRAGV